jgi:parvulin-like peptidyl-prolyl isomerase
VVRRFGEEFALALRDLPVGEWAGPVASTCGFRVVRLSARLVAELPALDEIRAEVVRDYRAERRDSANRELYEKLRGEYRVEVDEDAVRTALTDAPR